MENSQFPALNAGKTFILLAVMASSAVVCGCLSFAGLPGEFYVAPHGRPDGNGSKQQPWDLQTALSHPSEVNPGDFIWLSGGNYQGPFLSRLTGAEGAPITVAGIPGQRVTLEGCHCPDAVLSVEGGWAIYRDFEVTNTNTDRYSDRVRGPGLWVMGPHTVFANLVVHNNNQGFSFWTPAADAELYGNLIFDNGWDASDRGHGHAIYTQNRTGNKRIVDNVIFDQFGDGLHVYGTEDADLNNYHIEGNILFNNGSLSATGFSRNILIGGGKVALDCNVVNNVTYYPVAQKLGDNNIGYRAGTKNAAVMSNYFVGGNLAVIAPENLVLSGNFLFLNVPVIVSRQFPDNQYILERPAKNAVFVRKNEFERGRSHIAVFNWQGAAEVAADLSGSGLQPGECYELRNVQDYYGRAIKGEYTGNPIPVPLKGWNMREIKGWTAAASALPEFGAFIVSPTPCEDPALVRESDRVSRERSTKR